MTEPVPPALTDPVLTEHEQGGTTKPGQPPDPQAEFRKRLTELTPRVYMTPALMTINMAVFVLMVVCGISPTEPTTADLLRWGAKYGPLGLPCLFFCWSQPCINKPPAGSSA
jgi:hypothetical protein